MKLRTALNHENGILGALGTFLLTVGGQTFVFLAQLGGEIQLLVAAVTVGGPILHLCLNRYFQKQKREEDVEWLKKQKESLQAQNDALSHELVSARRELRIYKPTPVDPDQ